MFKSGQPILAKSEGLIILAAAEIPRLGFGKSSITRKIMHGLTSTTLAEARRWAYRLSCGDLVVEHSECGAPCPFCLAELQAPLEQQPRLALFNDEQLRWICTPCKDHSFRCTYPWCPATPCYRHIAAAPDGNGHFCPPHYMEIAAQLDFEDLEQRTGLVISRTIRFARSLFFTNDDNPTLPR